MLLLGLAFAAGPRSPGHSLTAGLGYADYTEVRLWYTAREAVFLGDYRYTGAHGLVLAAELSAAAGDRQYIPGLVVPWRSDFAGTAALRVGYERRFFGLQTGVLYWLDPTEKGPLPSVDLWAGHPAVHLWSRFNAQTTVGDVQAGRASGGLGSMTEVSHVEVGAYSTGWSGPGFQWNTEARVGPVWVGVRGRFYPVRDEWDRHETRALLTVRGQPWG